MQDLLVACSSHNSCTLPLGPLVQGAMKEQLRKQASGLDKWLMTLHAESYMTVFQDKTSDLVYLTAGLHLAYQQQSFFGPFSARN